MKQLRAFLSSIALCFYAVVPSFASGPACYGSSIIQPTGPDPEAVIVGDLNVDGNDDFVVSYLDLAHSCSGGVNVFVNRGDGTFQEKDLATLPLPTFLAVGDFNRDGKQDLAVWSAACGSSAASVQIHIGNGDGTFTPGSIYITADTVAGMVAADFTGDFINDLFLANSGEGKSHRLLVGAGDGTFPNAKAVPPPAGFTRVIGVSNGDFNADGMQDLAMFNADFQSAIVLSSGHGTFQPNPFIYPGFMQAIGDLNGDARLDVATLVPNGSRYNVTVYAGNGDGTVTMKDSVGAANSGQIIVANVGKDGIADLIFASSGVHILKGKGDGTFAAAQSFRPTFDAVNLAGGDFDRNGLTDLVYTNSGAASASMLINTGKCR